MTRRRERHVTGGTAQKAIMAVYALRSPARTLFASADSDTLAFRDQSDGYIAS